MLEDFYSLLEAYLDEADKYEEKPTKASAKRMRDFINRMQKIAVSTKKTLIELDKAGY